MNANVIKSSSSKASRRSARSSSNRHVLREVKGIGCVFIGPADLATSLGYPGETDHPEVRRVIDDVAAAARDAGVPFGITTDRERVEGQVRAGYQFLVTSDADAIERGRHATPR